MPVREYVEPMGGLVEGNFTPDHKISTLKVSACEATPSGCRWESVPRYDKTPGGIVIEYLISKVYTVA